MATCSYFLYVFLLLMYPSSSLQKIFHTYNVMVTSLLPSDVCMNNQSSKVHKQGSSLEVVHKYGPCIKQKNGEMGFSIPNEAEMLLQDQARVDSMHSRYSKSSGQFKEMKTKIPFQSGDANGAGTYIVTVAIGTPKEDLSLIFDTGSGLTWTQCQPCVGSCYSQSQPIFDPRMSSSYRNVSCSSSYCNQLPTAGAARGCSSSTCLYKVQYGDGSYSIGFFATEKLTISSSDVFDGFLFGCGQQNVVTGGQRKPTRGGQQNAARGGLSAGLIALGPGPISFPVQTASKYKRIFSYCIPSSSSSTGYLSFGAKMMADEAVKYTHLSPDFQDMPYYGLDIIGIRVGGQRLSIDESIFSSSGAVIDSGTMITRLQPTAYTKLSSAFQKSMKNYPRTDGISILDTCYDLSGYNSVLVPKISIIFKGGVEFEIKPLGILLAVGDLKQVCLAFAANRNDGDFAIFGNTQQKTYEVVHDNNNERVGFAPAAC